jgi:hypothetical protein
MEIVNALGGIGAAFGLSTSAGLNAYIPLLIFALVARFTDLIQLTEPYDLLTRTWMLILLAVLLLVEMLVDKVPAADTVNDIIQTLIRPTAGAVLFAANANIISDVSPVVALLIGVLLAGGVHSAKSIARPAVTASTAGTGNWLVSLLEDVVAVIMSILSILLPVVMFFVTILLLFFGGRWVLRWRRRRASKAVAGNLSVT